ncbi:MAG TPA: AAA family ATPase [Rickettsiales bacterium]|nr:AAA family ATPase [Rickettsiales bacterium]
MSTASSSNGSQTPFMAFSNDQESLALLKQFATTNGWPESVVHTGDIDTATTFLKSSPSPKVLFVDIGSTTETVSPSLDALADVCDPNIKVIVSGKVNEYSFYCWLVEIGVSNYLLKPFTLAALNAAYQKALDVAPVHSAKPEEAKKASNIITVIGTRGGVGATTVAVNMAWILANRLHHKTTLLDFDPQFGTVALSLDLEPGRGLRDALEKPDRIDSLFVDRVMVRVDDYLSFMSAEEPLEENIVTSEPAAEGLFKQCRTKFSHIVIDLPRVLNPFTRRAITQADHVVCVTEYSMAGLRESLRYLEYFRNVLKIKPPVFVANKIGLAGKHQMPQSEFEKGLGAKVAFNIPFVLDAHAAATAGEVLAETAQNLPATKILHSLAMHFSHAEPGEKLPGKQSGLFTLFKKDK